MDISRLEKGHFEGDISHSSGDQLERRDLGTVEEHNAANASSSPLTATTNETRSKVDGLLRGLLKVVEDFGGTDETTDRGHQDEAAVVGSTDPVSQWRLPSSVRNPRDNLRNSPAAIAATQNARIMTSLSAADHVPRQGSEQHIMVEECGPNYKSCRERWSKHRHGPNVKIRVISDLAIQVSERYRREIREEWMSGCSSDELLDSWKYLWRCEGGASRGLSYWACEDAKRQELQLALIDALTSGRPAPFFLWIMDKDFRTIACWVSLIGIRLDELYRFAKTHDMVLPSHRSATISPVAQIEILIEYLWASNKSEDPVVGEILENCYRRKILVQPCFDDPPDFFSSRLILISHVYAVRVAVYLVNLLFKHDIPVLRPHEDIDKIWTTPVNQIEIGMRQNTANSHLNVGVNPFFSISDFNLRDLQRLGGLRLLWTPYWDEHLKLENDDGSYVLYIYWFHHDLSCYFSTIGLCGGLTESDRYDRTQEIVRTLKLLFTSKADDREFRREYGKLRSPMWLSLLAASDLGTWNREQENQGQLRSPPPLSRFMLDHGDGSTDFCTETRFHLAFYTREDKERTHRKLSYSSFPHYGQRLAELRAYMDSQHARGLRGLWEDNRNSLAYYTFWFVIFFSSLTIFLGVGALATSIAQTWASFRSLHASNPKQ